MAALGFVHVVSGDEEGQALSRRERRESAPRNPRRRLGVNTRGGFIQQQQLWFVDETRRQREALLPAAGKLPGELFLATGQT